MFNIFLDIDSVDHTMHRLFRREMAGEKIGMVDILFETLREPHIAGDRDGLVDAIGRPIPPAMISIDSLLKFGRETKFNLIEVMQLAYQQVAKYN